MEKGGLSTLSERRWARLVRNCFQLPILIKTCCFSSLLELLSRIILYHINRWCPTTGKSNRIGGRGKHNNGVRLTTIDEKCLGFIVWMTAFVLHHLTGFVTNFECGFIDSVTSKSFIVAWTFTIGYTFTLAALIMVCLRPMKECGTKVEIITKPF